MTLLGFSVGTSNTKDSSMNKTLDDIIKDRRKGQLKVSKKGPKKTSNADRTIATGRAKREAATKARRGLSQTKKADPMEIEREVYRQTRKTANSKKRSEKKATSGKIAPDSSLRDKKKKKQAEKNASPAVFGGKTPPKKAIEAAMKGMKDAGFKIPAGHQLVMTFIPFAPIDQKAGKKTEKKQAKVGKSNAAAQKSKAAGKKSKGDGRRKKS